MSEPEIDQADFEAMKRACREVGLYVNTHKYWTPRPGEGPFYVMHQRKPFAGKHDAADQQSLIKYATADQVWDFVVKMREAFPERVNPGVKLK